VAREDLISMPATRSKNKEAAKRAEADAAIRHYEAAIARRDARTAELRALRLAKEAEQAKRA
jgi:hypothetical protein